MGCRPHAAVAVWQACADELWCTAGGSHGFLACAALYAIGNACIGASPVAYAADVMPAKLGGFGLGMYRCAGDIGEWKRKAYVCLMLTANIVAGMNV